MKTISWTGLVLLQSKPQESVSLIKDFLNEWRDQLPEPWREQATLDALGVLHQSANIVCSLLTIVGEICPAIK